MPLSSPPRLVQFSAIVVVVIMLFHGSSAYRTFSQPRKDVLAVVRQSCQGVLNLAGYNTPAWSQRCQPFHSFVTTSSKAMTSSSSSTFSTETTPTRLPEAVLVERETGAFVKHFPQVYPGETHYRRAYRRAMKEIRVDGKIINQRNAQRKYTAQFFDHLMKGLTVPITDILTIYQKNFRDLHPYEATVANLTITARMKAGKYDLQMIMSELKKLRATTSKLAKEYASRAKEVASAVDAKELLIEGTTKLEELYINSVEAKALVELTELHKDLRKIPVIHLDIPAIVLVGSPNVGKSSIVRAVSSGTPEVNDYPFTTRGVTIGHIFHNANQNLLSASQQKEFAKKYQVMDTPGLLDRPEEDRNEMEKLTFASLAHLPTAVVYVIDPTGLSGEQSNLQAQLNVRNYLKSRFPRRPWVDVISKGDIEIPPEIQAQLPSNALRVSVHTKQNVAVLQTHMTTMLEQLRLMLEARKQPPPSSPQ